MSLVMLNPNDDTMLIVKKCNHNFQNLIQQSSIKQSIKHQDVMSYVQKVQSSNLEDFSNIRSRIANTNAKLEQAQTTAIATMKQLQQSLEEQKEAIKKLEQQIEELAKKINP